MSEYEKGWRDARVQIAEYFEHLAREPIGTINLTGLQAAKFYEFAAAWVRNDVDGKWAEGMRRSGARR